MQIPHSHPQLPHSPCACDIEKLLFIQSADNYLIFHEPGRQTVGLMTLTSLLERLPADTFMRMHHSHIVSLAHVERFEDSTLIIGSAPPARFREVQKGPVDPLEISLPLIQK